MALFTRTLSRGATLKPIALVHQRCFTSRRVDRRGTAVILRRADLSEEALEREVRKGLDQEGDYTKGELPEQPEFLTHWSVEWSEPPLISNKGILFAWLLFFGGLLTIREILKATRDFYPLTTPREELGDGKGQYGAEYVAELEAKGIHVPGISASTHSENHH